MDNYDLNTYDWKEVFAFAGEISPNDDWPTSNSKDMQKVSNVPTDSFSRDDINTIEWIREGENDEDDWLIGGTLKDGRWFFISAWCDYTGWDCRSGGKAYVGSSKDDIERWAMGNIERTIFNISLDGETREKDSVY